MDRTYPRRQGIHGDIAPSFVFDSVTYVEIDKRTPTFFADVDGVGEIVSDHNGPGDVEITFIHADYTSELGLADDHFDLLHEAGRGIRYTKAPFAYLFTRIG